MAPEIATPPVPDIFLPLISMSLRGLNFASTPRLDIPSAAIEQILTRMDSKLPVKGCEPGRPKNSHPRPDSWNKIPPPPVILRLISIPLSLQNSRRISSSTSWLYPTRAASGLNCRNLKVAGEFPEATSSRMIVSNAMFSAADNEPVSSKRISLNDSNPDPISQQRFCLFVNSRAFRFENFKWKAYSPQQ